MDYSVEARISSISNFNMREIQKFILRVVVYLGVFALFTLAYFWIFKSNIPENKRIGPGIYRLLNSSKQINPETQILVLGESVAAQIYPNREYVKEITAYTNNQGVSLVGYYHLLSNFIHTNQRQDFKVFLVYHPAGFSNNLDNRYIFNYYLKPFQDSKYKMERTELANELISQIPFYWLADYKIIRESNWAPTYRTIHNPTETEMSPIAAEYLKKMDDLCRENNIPFEVKAPFISTYYKQENFEAFKEQLKTLEVDHLFKTYFDNIIWLDDHLFVDHLHLKKKPKEEILGYNYLKLK